MEEFIGKIMTKNSVFYIQKKVWQDVEEYEEDYKAVIKQRENFGIPFRHQSPQIEFRKFLLEFIKRHCVERKFSKTCFSLSVYILDIFMDNHAIIPDRLLLVAIVCLILAAKMEENKDIVPKFSELNATIDDRYSIDDFKKMEITIWKYFDCSLLFATATHYLYYYIQKIVSNGDLLNGLAFRTLFYDLHASITIYLDRITEDLHYMHCYTPSKLAAAIISASRIENNLSSWTTQLENVTNYKIEELAETVELLLKGVYLQCNGCGLSNEEVTP